MKRTFFPSRLFIPACMASFALLHASTVAQTGVLQWSAWNNLSGVSVEDLTQAPKFLNAPDVNFTVAGSGSPIDSNDSFGGRLRGTITAPVTGNYTFWIASDDSSELWLGTSGSRFSKQLIASVNGWTPVQSWNVYGSQQSVSVALQAGQKYWIEALVKEGGGGDHVEIAWEYPGQSRQMIPTAYLEWPGADAADANDDGLPDTWATANGATGAYNDPDHDGALNIEEYQASTNPLQPGITGVLEWNIWRDINGGSVSDLTGNSKFLQNPSETAFVNSAASPVDFADNFGTRLRGTITAPVTGTYQFWIASDDSSELWLGTGASRFTKRRIAYLNGWTGVAQWENNPSQQSVGIELQAGQHYWIEALAKDGGGGDHVEIAWQYPGQGRQIIPSTYLNPSGVDIADLNDDGLPDAWVATYGVTGGAFGDADADGISNLDEYQNGSHPNQQGSLEWSVWTDIGGETLSALINHPKFLQPPDQVSQIHGSAAPNDYGTSFGQRLRGTITAPVTGNYTFWMSSDNQGQLWLGTTASRFTKQKIAYVDGWTGFQQWDANPSQRSVNISLQDGQKYWIEAIAKEDSGGDNLAIAWEYPGQSRQLIPKIHLAPPDAEGNDANDDGLPDDWQANYGVEGAFADEDMDGIINLTEFQNGSNPVGGIPGHLTRNVWNDISGETIASLTNSPKFLQTPNVTELSASGAIFPPSSSAERFGQRYRGTVTAPATGEYTFWIAGDDNCELWLSTTGQKFQKSLIAKVVAGQSPQAGSVIDIGNTGIEIPNKGYSGWDYYSGDCAGWIFNGGGVAQNGSPWFQPSAPEGVQAMFLQAGDVKRSFYISDSGTYQLRFKAVGRQGEYGPAGVIVKIDDVTLLTLPAGELSQSEWRTFTIPQVNLSAGNHELKFVHNNTLGGDKSVSIDDVNLSFVNQWLSYGSGRVGVNEFDRYPGQKSSLVTLQQGQEYYIEILHKQAIGEAHFEVAWQKPGSSRESIPTQHLSSFALDPLDQDDDELPDNWENQHNISSSDNGKTLFANGSLGDPDADGITNYDEWKLGTNPKNSDSDSDGIGDFAEIHEFGSNPLQQDISLNETSNTPGSQATVIAGNWQQRQDGSIAGTDGSGSLTFAFNITANGFYAGNLRFGAGDSVNAGKYRIVAYLDGVIVDTIERLLQPKDESSAQILFPHLAAGDHQLKLVYDNASAYQRLKIQSFSISQVSGADTNNDGIPDSLSGHQVVVGNVETPSGTSYTSPAFVEGNGRYEFVDSNGDEVPTPVPGNRWFVNVALPSNGDALQRNFTFSNTNKVIARSLTWAATNIADESPIIIRQGDSLRLTSHPGTTPDGATVTLYVNDILISSTTANTPLVKAFDSIGNFEVKAERTEAGGQVTTKKKLVTVKGGTFAGSPIVLVNHYRDWECPNLAPASYMELDAAVPATAYATQSGGTLFHLTLPENCPHYAVARLYPDGPIYAAAILRSQRVFEGEETLLELAETYPDGSNLVKMDIVASPMYSDSEIRLEIFVSGVVFQDGSINKILHAQHFGELGRTTVFFVKSAETTTSVCHTNRVYQLGSKRQL